MGGRVGERAEPLKVPAMRSIVGKAAQGGAVFQQQTLTGCMWRALPQGFAFSPRTRCQI